MVPVNSDSKSNPGLNNEKKEDSVSKEKTCDLQSNKKEPDAKKEETESKPASEKEKSKDIKEENKELISPFLKQNTPSNNEPGVSIEDKLAIATDDLPEFEKMTNVFEGTCKLYRFDRKKGAMVARGNGKIFINLWDDNGLYRVIMCREKVKRMGCNHFIDYRYDAKKHSSSENTVVWYTEGNKCESDEDLEPTQTFVSKFMSSEKMTEFIEQYTLAQEKNKIILEKKAKKD